MSEHFLSVRQHNSTSSYGKSSKLASSFLLHFATLVFLRSVLFNYFCVALRMIARRETNYIRILLSRSTYPIVQRWLSDRSSPRSLIGDVATCIDHSSYAGGSDSANSKVKTSWLRACTYRWLGGILTWDISSIWNAWLTLDGEEGRRTCGLHNSNVCLTRSTLFVSWTVSMTRRKSVHCFFNSCK